MKKSNAKEFNMCRRESCKLNNIEEAENKEQNPPNSQQPSTSVTIDECKSFVMERSFSGLDFFTIVGLNQHNNYLNKKTEEEEEQKNDFTFARPDPPRECHYCCKTFINKNKYKWHSIKHMKKLRCNICNKEYQCSITLKRHRLNCKRPRILITTRFPKKS